MLTMASVFYWAFVVVSVPLFSTLAMLVRVLTAPFDRRRAAVHAVSTLWGRTLIAANPLWSCRVIHRERLPQRGAAVIVANHASLLDILVLFCVRRPFRWISKDSNFRIPFLGWGMKAAGYIPVTRGDRGSVIEMMRRAEASLAIRMPVLFFPEGTRSPTDELLPFKPGAFELAHRAGVSVIPVAVHGTREALPKHGLILRSRMDAVVAILEPLDPSRFRSADDMKEAAQAAIASALNKAEGDLSAA